MQDWRSHQPHGRMKGPQLARGAPAERASHWVRPLLLGIVAVLGLLLAMSLLRSF